MVYVPKAMAVAVLLAMGAQEAPRFVPSGEKVRVRDGGVWCVPVWDGEHVVVSSENKDGVILRKYSETLEEIGKAVVVATPQDTRAQKRIADHKHLFLRDHHYVVFSVAGDKDSYLLKLDRTLKRIKIVPVVERSDHPTNDMFMVSDGEKLHVGHFLPGHGHRVYSFDPDLKSAGPPVTIGGGDRRHSNGASAVFVDGQFVVLAPLTLNPREARGLYRLTFDRNWKPVGERATLVDAGECELMVTGLTWFADQERFVVHYVALLKEGKGHQDGVVKRRVFARDWNAAGEAEPVASAAERPHTLALKNYLYLGYDSREGVFVQRFEIKKEN